jgi:hypothetical protein
MVRDLLNKLKGEYAVEQMDYVNPPFISSFMEIEMGSTVTHIHVSVSSVHYSEMRDPYQIITYMYQMDDEHFMLAGNKINQYNFTKHEMYMINQFQKEIEPGEYPEYSDYIIKRSLCDENYQA